MSVYVGLAQTDSPALRAKKKVWYILFICCERKIKIPDKISEKRRSLREFPHPGDNFSLQKKKEREREKVVH